MPFQICPPGAAAEMPAVAMSDETPKARLEKHLPRARRQIRRDRLILKPRTLFGTSEADRNHLIEEAEVLTDNWTAATASPNRSSEFDNRWFATGNPETSGPCMQRMRPIAFQLPFFSLLDLAPPNYAFSADLHHPELERD